MWGRDLMSQPPDEVQIITHRIPRIEVYQVTDDELQRIEDGYGQVGQDLTFAVTSLSFSVAFAIALATGRFSDKVFALFLILMIIFAVVALYTGFRWFRVRRAAPNVIATIRARKTEPEDDSESGDGSRPV